VFDWLYLALQNGRLPIDNDVVDDPELARALDLSLLEQQKVGVLRLKSSNRHTLSGAATVCWSVRLSLQV
jgi:hypothetical protein